MRGGKCQKNTPRKVLSTNPRGKYDNSTTGPKKTRILEDPEDTDTSSEGSKPNSKDHQARIKEKKESISSS